MTIHHRSKSESVAGNYTLCHITLFPVVWSPLVTFGLQCESKKVHTKKVNKKSNKSIKAISRQICTQQCNKKQYIELGLLILFMSIRE